jgi:hypothetical protein
MIIKKYNNFITDKAVQRKTKQFINDEISESEFITFLQQEIVNESVIDVVKDKVINVLSSFLSKSKEVGFKIFEKLKSILNWIISKLKTFKQKNPTLYKIITVTVIVSVILFISTASLHAAVNGNPIPVDKIDMAIGLIKELIKSGDLSDFDGSRAIAHLVDLRDGKIDLPEVGQRAINIANSALNTVERISTEENSQISDASLSLIEKGKQVLSVVVEKIGPTEKVKLIYK